MKFTLPSGDEIRISQVPEGKRCGELQLHVTTPDGRSDFLAALTRRGIIDYDEQVLTGVMDRLEHKPSAEENLRKEARQMVFLKLGRLVDELLERMPVGQLHRFVTEGERDG